jgi:hypothetical protein
MKQTEKHLMGRFRFLKMGLLATSLMAITSGAHAQVTINFWDQI